MKKASNGLIDRDTLLCHAKLLLGKDRYTQEDNARVSGLLNLAEKLGTHGEIRASSDSDEVRRFERRLLGGERRVDLSDSEKRDITETGAPTVSLPTSVLVPQEYAPFTIALKAYDQLFDDTFTTHLTASPGKPILLPILDDTSSASSTVAEGTQDTEQDPSFSFATLPAAPTYRSPEIKISNETLTDAPSDTAKLLVAAMAIRHARGIGAALVNLLLSSAPVSITAYGSSKNTGGSETGGTTIGSSDLINLRASINPAYRSSGRAAWVINDNTLAAIDGLLDRNGRPVFGEPQFDGDGYRLILGYRVCLSPSMPNIGLNNKPIAFGDLSRFVVRKSPVGVARLFEKYAEFDVSAFRSWMRCNGTLLIPSGGDSPIKVLQNAAS